MTVSHRRLVLVDELPHEAVSGARYEAGNPGDESVLGTAAGSGEQDAGRVATSGRRVFDEASSSTDHVLQLDKVLGRIGTAIDKGGHAQRGPAPEHGIEGCDELLHRKTDGFPAA